MVLSSKRKNLFSQSHPYKDPDSWTFKHLVIRVCVIIIIRNADGNIQLLDWYPFLLFHPLLIMLIKSFWWLMEIFIYILFIFIICSWSCIHLAIYILLEHDIELWVWMNIPTCFPDLKYMDIATRTIRISLSISIQTKSTTWHSTQWIGRWLELGFFLLLKQSVSLNFNTL